jgi:hypothetical protein
VKQLAPLLAALATIAALEAQTPAGVPSPAPPPWQPRPVIIIDPRPYLSSPSPHPAHHATPHPKRGATTRPRAMPTHHHATAVSTPETFERIETSPTPTPPHPRSAR